MNTLEKIVADKRELIRGVEPVIPISELKRAVHYHRQPISLKERLDDKMVPGFIAEFKRKSPSKGDIHKDADVLKITKGYETTGADAISVLTDQKYFGGTNADLIEARSVVNCPILRKDFTISSYQIHEAKAIGADLILLIAAVLTEEEILRYSEIAHDLGLEVLLEIHSLDELHDSYLESIDILGVNNRNLKTFNTSIQNSIDIYKALPGQITKISESGLSSMHDVNRLFECGYKGFLIGEQFMKSDDPPSELQIFLKDVKIGA